MLLILRSAVALGLASATIALRRAATTVAGLLVAAALLATSLGFFTLAAYRALHNAVGDVYALLIVGCAYFLASLIALLVVQLKPR